MADVFVSYSRQDAPFVKRLVQGLQDQGRDVWLDAGGIADGEVFPDALKEAIEAATGFIFVISPDSARSEFCGQEVELALSLNKRMIPIEYRPSPDADLPEGVRIRQWVAFGEDADFDVALRRVTRALDHDLDHARAHTRWLATTREWSQAPDDDALLLRGARLAAAEAWLASAEARDPAPTADQRAYVTASRAAATRRGRVVTGASLCVAIVAVALVTVALVSRQQAADGRAAARRGQATAVTERAAAASRALAAQAESQVARDPELAVLLARRSVQTSPTPDALLALRDALDRSPVLDHLAPTGSQGCGKAPGLTFSPNVAYAPDGDDLAQASCDGAVRLLRATDGRLERRVTVARQVLAVSYSPDGRRLAAGIEDGALVLDARTLRVERRLRGGGVIEFVAFSHDGRTLVGGGTGGAVSWSLVDARRQVLVPPGAGAVSSAVFLPGGRRVLVGLSNLYANPAHGLEVLDARSGRRVADGLPHRSALDIAVRPGGREIAVSAFDADAGSRRAGQVATVRRLALPSLQARSMVYGSATEGLGDVAWAPAGDRLAVARGATGVDVFAPRGGPALVHLRGGVGTSAVAFSPDGARLTSYDVTGNAVIWSVGDPGPVLVRLGAGRGVGAIANGPDRLWVSTRSGAVLGVDRRNGRIQRRLRVAPTTGAPKLAPDGRRVAPVPATTPPDRFFALPSGRLQLSVPGPGEARTAVEPSPDGAEAVVAPAARGLEPLELADSRGRKLATLRGTPPGCGTGWSTGGQWSPDGRWYVGWADCGEVGIYDMRRRALAASYTVSGTPVQAAASPDGRTIALASLDGTITIYSISTQRVVRVLLGTRRGALAADAHPPSMTFSADGRWLLYATGHTVATYEASTWNLARALELPAAVIALAPEPGRPFFDVATRGGLVRRYPVCPACADTRALLAEAARRRLRPLTAAERSTYLAGG